ncbi:MAG: hypothetical protein IJU33_06095 [Bacteroidales bacterium]|nr:hypothetical protein [Bacteroidales bacterium]
MKNMKIKPNARLGALRTIAIIATTLLAFNTSQVFGQWNNWCYKDYTYSASNQTFTVPAGCDDLYIEAIGAGGGGGNARSASSTNARVGTGGGGGGYARKHITNPTESDTYTIKIGQGGSATNAGGNTTVTGTGCNISANGGGGGTSNQRGSTSVGAGGTATGGDVNYTGGRGGYSCDNRLTDGGLVHDLVGSGAGGGAAGGNGNGGYDDQPIDQGITDYAKRTQGAGGGGDANGFSGNWLKGGNGGEGMFRDSGWGNGDPGKNYGGGGGGARDHNRTDRSGGAGANGFVRVWFHITKPITLTVDPVAANICPGDSKDITSSYSNTLGTVTASWSNSKTTWNITESPASTTTYTLTLTDKYTYASGTCQVTKTASSTITVLTPAVTLNDMTEKNIVAGGSTTLTASVASSSGDVTYAWSPATGLNTTTGATVTASPTETTTYTVTATATSGSCTSTASKTVKVNVEVDADAPVVDCPTIDPVDPADVPTAYNSLDEFLDAGGTYTTTKPIDENSFSMLNEAISGTEPCDYTITRTYGVETTSGNLGTCSQIIVVKDNTPPTPVATKAWPEDVTGKDECYDETTAKGYLMSADEALTYYTGATTCTVTDEVISSDNCSWEVKRTYTITDACGVAVNPAPTMSAKGGDNTAPTLIDPNTTLEDLGPINDCYSADYANQLTSDADVKALYTDCGTITVDHNDEIQSTDNKSWKIVRTYTVTDGCGKSTTISQSISGGDKTAPELIEGTTWPTNDEAQNQDACLKNANASSLKSDADIKALYTDCSGTDNIFVGHFDDTTSTNDCEWKITRTYVIVDINMNPVLPVPTMEVTGGDKSAPELTGTWTSELPDVVDACLNDATATGLLDEEGAAALFTDCDTVIVSFTESTTGNDCEWTVTRTYTVEDRCGNTYDNGTDPLTMTVRGGDKTAPVVTAPQDTTIYKDKDCNADTIPAITGVATATDRCDANPTVSYINIDITPDDACEGTLIIKRRWTAQDVCGNKADTVDQIITVLDTIRPTFIVPKDTTIYKDSDCNFDADPEFTGMIADVWDNCSTKLDTSYVDEDVTEEFVYCEGHTVIKRTWRLTDACGNISLSDSIQYIAVRDTVRPTFTAPKDTTIYKDENCEYDITVENVGDVIDEADNCTKINPLEATYRDSIITPEDACEGMLIIQRIWSLIDACDNKAEEQSQIITIKDTLAPTFTVPADIVLCRDENRKIAADTTITGKPTDIRDNCSEVTMSFTDVDTSGTDNEYRIITRVWEAKDACENVAVDTQLITIAPAISEDNFIFACPTTDTTIYLKYSACDTLVVFDTLAYTCDIANVNVTLTTNQPASKRLGVGETEIIWTATDSCGFTVSCSFNLIIKFPPCGTADSVVLAKDEEGNEYKTIRVGCDCWLAENLKSSAEKAAAYQNDAANEENYGKLYSWYSTVKVAEGDNNTLPETTTIPAINNATDGVRATTAEPTSNVFVQGICPEGWAVPTMEDYSRLVANAGGISKIKSPNTAYWLPGSEGDSEGNSLFEARGAGYCNFDTQEFFNLKGTTGFWSCDSKANTSTASVFKLSYICNDAIPEDNSKTIGYSVRCIRKY